MILMLASHERVSGALSAACWSVMCHLGEEGYLERTKQIMEAANKIAKGVEDIPGIVLQGEVRRRRVKVVVMVPSCSVNASLPEPLSSPLPSPPGVSRSRP